MGGKSRKTGGVSRSLVARLTANRKSGGGASSSTTKGKASSNGFTLSGTLARDSGRV